MLIDAAVHNIDEKSEFLDYPHKWWKNLPLDIIADELEVYVRNYKVDQSLVNFDH